MLNLGMLYRLELAAVAVVVVCSRFRFTGYFGDAAPFLRHLHLGVRRDEIYGAGVPRACSGCGRISRGDTFITKVASCHSRTVFWTNI